MTACKLTALFFKIPKLYNLMYSLTNLLSLTVNFIRQLEIEFCQF